MVKIVISQEEIDRAIEISLLDVVNFLTNKIKSITPRDPERPPNNYVDRRLSNGSIKRYYREPGPVTGNLERSVNNQKKDKYTYMIGVPANAAGTQKSRPVDYAIHLEFWTRFMKPRSFLREWLSRFWDEAIKHFSLGLKRILWNKF